jgi:hypothetical protein
MGYYDGTFKRYPLAYIKSSTTISKPLLLNRVVICCDHIRSQQELEDTLVHELTHAFDSLRKGKFKSACHLIACTEIRASALGKLKSV